MAKNIFPDSELPIRRSVELLPQIFQTDANAKFLAGVVDPLIQPGVLEKTVGYVGRRFGKTYNSKDIYLDSNNTLRSRYQLEPGVVIRDENSRITNFYDYIDFKNLSDFVILKIDVKTLRNIKLYDDPKYQPTIKAHYTYDSISPYSIVIIKK